MLSGATCGASVAFLHCDWLAAIKERRKGSAPASIWLTALLNVRRSRSQSYALMPMHSFKGQCVSLIIYFKTYEAQIDEERRRAAKSETFSRSLLSLARSHRARPGGNAAKARFYCARNRPGFVKRSAAIRF